MSLILLILSFDGRRLCTWMSPDSPPCSPRRNLISLSDTSILFHTSLLTIVPNWAEYRNRRVLSRVKNFFLERLLFCVCIIYTTNPLLNSLFRSLSLRPKLPADENCFYLFSLFFSFCRM